jgi:hypothetical protein
MLFIGFSLRVIVTQGPRVIQLIAENSWIQVLLGQRIQPARTQRLADRKTTPHLCGRSRPTRIPPQDLVTAGEACIFWHPGLRVPVKNDCAQLANPPRGGDAKPPVFTPFGER